MAQTPQAEILKQREEKKREAAAAPREVRPSPPRPDARAAHSPRAAVCGV
jgi:hypothetical protein